MSGLAGIPAKERLDGLVCQGFVVRQRAFFSDAVRGPVESACMGIISATLRRSVRKGDCKLRVADCDQNVRGAIGGGGIAVSGGLGGVACASGAGRRHGDGAGKSLCGGAVEGEQRGVLLRWDGHGGLQSIVFSAGRKRGLLVDEAAPRGL